MPLRINWKLGKYRGISLYFLGIMGLSQSLIVVPIAQYVLNVGSIFALVLVPLGVVYALTYSAKILFESFSQQRVKSSGRRALKGEIYEAFIMRPVGVVLAVFLLVFFIAYSLVSPYMEPLNTFIIAENSGAIASLLVASFVESQYVT